MHKIQRSASFFLATAYTELFEADPGIAASTRRPGVNKSWRLARIPLLLLPPTWLSRRCMRTWVRFQTPPSRRDRTCSTPTADDIGTAYRGRLSLVGSFALIPQNARGCARAHLRDLGLGPPAPRSPAATPRLAPSMIRITCQFIVPRGSESWHLHARHRLVRTEHAPIASARPKVPVRHRALSSLRSKPGARAWVKYFRLPRFTKTI
ncbi:hypothetical protein B0H15DRAFT_487785 [Mycena belliarum]|uniref:Uncharacterized protein n=1 Tax=Mycena belliarum TaxID=1033014 RepID=A0AAD6TXW2_9AGAR|nr:hypothetical protein B0H15DRAFT_487785 [Mycena belliae]